MTTAEEDEWWIISSPGIRKCRRCKRWIAQGERIWRRQTNGAMYHIDEARCATALPMADPPPFVPATVEEYWQVFERAAASLESAKWTFAKTMPDVPHEWTHRRSWKTQSPERDAMFTDAVLRIKQLGIERRWRSMVNRKLDINDRYYWVMDPIKAPAEVGWLINRAVRLTYEAAPPQWFPTWPAPLESLVTEAVEGPLKDRSVLDIGATWVAATQEARRYLAIGPPKDLVRLNETTGCALILETGVQGFYDPLRFDVVAALYGAANHLSRTELERLPLLTTPGGVVIAMFDKTAVPTVFTAVWPTCTWREVGAYYFVVVR
jgi:hypothetical protein